MWVQVHMGLHTVIFTWNIRCECLISNLGNVIGTIFICCGTCCHFSKWISFRFPKRILKAQNICVCAHSCACARACHYSNSISTFLLKHIFILWYVTRCIQFVSLSRQEKMGWKHRRQERKNWQRQRQPSNP